MNKKQLGLVLEAIYQTYHQPTFISPDPLELVLEYENDDDRAFVALLSSSLAYGRVQQILSKTRSLLSKFGPCPWRKLNNLSSDQLQSDLSDWKYRLTTGAEMGDFLTRLIRWCDGQSLIEKLEKIPSDDPLKAHQVMAEALSPGRSTLISQPSLGSCCKRGMLFWRWMVRKDQIDLGLLQSYSPAKLLIPLDTHMTHFGRITNMLTRKTVDLKSTLELTQKFAQFDRNDPTRFDFSITRFGIHPELSFKEMKEQFGLK